MSRRFHIVIRIFVSAVVLSSAALAQAQSAPVATSTSGQQQPPTPQPPTKIEVTRLPAPVANGLPWVVSVVHRIEVRKLIQRMQKEGKRVGVPASMPETVFNFTTGAVLDTQGHIITRLTNLDPEDKDQTISVVTTDGLQLAAKFIGLDCPSGFAILEVPGLKVAAPAAAVPPPGEIVKILSADVSATTAGGQNQSKKNFYLSPSIKLLNGQLEADNPYAKLRGALMLRSPNFLSRNDGAIVTTADNQLLGLAQFAGFGRAYFFPVALLRDTITKRVLETRQSVAAGWLGITGINLFQMPPEEVKALHVEQRSGIFIKDVNPESPAAKSSIKPRDILIGFNEFTVTNTGELGALLSSSPAGESVKLRLLRDGQPLDVDVVLGAKACSEPAIALLEFKDNSPDSLETELTQRFLELAGQYQALSKEPKSPQRDEALRELRIEIGEIQDSMRKLGVNTLPTPQPQPQPNYGQNTTKELKSCQIAAAGFTARELSSQMATFYGAPRSVYITEVKPGSAAEMAGLHAADVIVAPFNGEPLTCSQLTNMFSTAKQSVPLKVIRKKQVLSVIIQQP